MPSGKRHYRITLDEVLGAHKRALQTGGLAGIRDFGSIQSAMARPYNGYYRAIEKKAAALVQSIAGNHGFVDGNKRTAVILTHLLLSKSSYRLVPIHGDDTIDVAMENMVVDAVCHKLAFDEIVRWFVDRLRRSR